MCLFSCIGVYMQTPACTCAWVCVTIGGTLYRKIYLGLANEELFAERWVLWMFYQLASAINYIHQRDIIHRYVGFGVSSCFLIVLQFAGWLCKWQLRDLILPGSEIGKHLLQVVAWIITLFLYLSSAVLHGTLSCVVHVFWCAHVLVLLLQ